MTTWVDFMNSGARVIVVGLVALLALAWIYRTFFKGDDDNEEKT